METGKILHFVTLTIPREHLLSFRLLCHALGLQASKDLLKLDQQSDNELTYGFCIFHNAASNYFPFYMTFCL